MGCCQGRRKRAWWKWLQPLMTHPLLNYIPGQDPELHPWTGGYISWGPAQESSVPGSPEHLQEEPPVELGSVSEPLLYSEYSDIRRSRSTVRTHLLSRTHIKIWSITWLSRLRQEGEFTITYKSTFQRRITSNHNWLPMQLLYYRYLFHISCHSNSCICILFWNIFIHNRTCSWLLEP
jgi:hypothetical protein